MTEAKAVIASVTVIPVKVIKSLPTGYQIPDPLPWAQLAGPLAAAEDALARLDERLAKSPIRDGFVARTHYTDAAACLWLEGELVHLDDLVLHDAHMDIRAPTHELTRAHAVLRARRRIADAKPDWALSPAGLAGLRGRGGQTDGEGKGNRKEGEGSFGGEDEDGDQDAADLDGPLGVIETDPHLAAAFAAVDAANARAEWTLAGEGRTRPDLDPLVYDPDWDEDARLDAWRAVVDETRALPPTLAAAIVTEAWDAIAPLQHTPWLGRMLAAALLRERGKTRWHLPCLHDGLKAIPRERRRPREYAARLAVQIEAMTAAAESGLKHHDRWLNQRTLLARKLDGRRATSRLPALLDYVLARPVVSAGMIADELGITPRAAQNLVAELGLREATGRRRYRAWGIA
jgi:Protein of unknown function (DUF1612)/HTH DNA binding domain